MENASRPSKRKSRPREVGNLRILGRPGAGLAVLSLGLLFLFIVVFVLVFLDV